MSGIILTTIPVSHTALAFDIEVQLPKDFLSMKKLNKGMPKVLREIAKDIKSFWDSEVGRKLKTARVKYRDGAKVTVVDDRTILISMEAFGGALEKGKKFDMKPGFLNSPKVKVKGQHKLPPFVARTLPKAPISIPTMTKFLIIPMRWSQGGTKFRTVSDKSPVDSWIWKRKDPNRAINISDTVVKEAEERIIPKHMKEYIEQIWRSS